MTVPLHVLMVTNKWPTPEHPDTTPFIKRQVDYLRGAGVDVDVFHFRGAKKLLNYVRAWRQLRSKLRHKQYDLIHAQFIHNGILALPKRVPLVVTCRGSDILGIVGNDKGGHIAASGIQTRLSRIVAARSDAVIIVAEHMKSCFHRSAPLSVIPSGVDFTTFRCMQRDEARRHLGLPADESLVLFAADPTRPEKRFALAKQAVEILNRSHPCQLVTASGVPYAAIPYYMNACDALIFTSVQEGSPDVIKEALACNLPIVSVPVGDVALRLQGIDGCELCPDDKPETIAEALGRVLKKGERIAGREAVQDLDEKLLTEKVISLYKNIARRQQLGQKSFA